MKLFKIILYGVGSGVLGAIMFFFFGLIWEIEDTAKLKPKKPIEGTFTAYVTIGGAIFMALGGVVAAMQKYKKTSDTDNSQKNQRWKL
jgi:hypothetical protein